MNEPISADGELHLVVAWVQGKTYQARIVQISQSVADTLRSHATVVADGLVDGTPYAPDSDIEDNSHMEMVRDQSIDTALLQELSKGASLDVASEPELRKKRLICHALSITTAQQTTVFVRKRSPIQLTTKSLVARLVDDRLDRLESPLFAFDNRYDAVFTADRVYILDKKAFEGLFKDSEAVLAKSHDWIAEVGRHVPFAPGSVEYLQVVLRRNSVLRNKFLAVKGRPYLTTVTADALRAEMKRHGMDPKDFMEGDTLKVTDQNVKSILRLLNEDLFQGGFSQQTYAAGTKRAL